MISLKGTTAKIYVLPDTKHYCFKPRSVPYVLKDKIEQELAYLQEQGIIIT